MPGLAQRGAKRPRTNKAMSDPNIPDSPERVARGSSSATGSATYRLLSNADAICPGDERLCDDCQTWEVLESNNPFFGLRYDGNFYVPMRRMSLNAPSSATAEQKL